MNKGNNTIKLWTNINNNIGKKNSQNKNNFSQQFKNFIKNLLIKVNTIIKNRTFSQILKIIIIALILTDKISLLLVEQINMKIYTAQNIMKIIN